MPFEHLGLSEKLLRAVADAGYQTPTPIQKQAIPAVLMGRDILGIAQTGTGKTAGFTLPMIDILSEGVAKARMPRSLILEPTRELAVQTEENFIKYGKNHKLTTALLIGGTSMDDQIKKLDKGADVLIATPGRLLDHFGRGNVMLNGVEILVIDEADRMLDMGFIPDVEKIRKLITRKPQTLFFSATMPPEIKRLTKEFLVEPKVIEVSPPTTAAETVAQNVVSVSPRNKLSMLEKLLRREEVKSALIFCNRKRDVAAVAKAMKKAGLNAGELHGDMDQSKRLEVLGKFKAHEVKYLIASDVAARGLDIPNVSHVFNFDVPMNVEDYIHRIGRTGRAGREGHAVLLATAKEREQVERIERATKVKITPLGEAPQPQAKPQGESAKKHGPEPQRHERHAHQKEHGKKPDHGKQEPQKPEPKRQESKPRIQRPPEQRPPRFEEDQGHLPAFLKVPTFARK